MCSSSSWGGGVAGGHLKPAGCMECVVSSSPYSQAGRTYNFDFRSCYKLRGSAGQSFWRKFKMVPPKWHEDRVELLLCNPTFPKVYSPKKDMCARKVCLFVWHSPGFKVRRERPLWEDVNLWSMICCKNYPNFPGYHVRKGKLNLIIYNDKMKKMVCECVLLNYMEDSAS